MGHVWGRNRGHSNHPDVDWTYTWIDYPGWICVSWDKGTGNCQNDGGHLECHRCKWEETGPGGAAEDRINSRKEEISLEEQVKADIKGPPEQPCLWILCRRQKWAVQVCGTTRYGFMVWLMVVGMRVVVGVITHCFVFCCWTYWKSQWRELEYLK